ncbi:MAG: ABC transporter substrate-binding protein, partial [Thaumarchaeota archaeon]|nr:ABC transporter substrate-binding protein [Nitrososphaerota archaeon]
MSSRGIGRNALIIVAVVIVIILAVGAYAAMSLGTSSTSSQTTSQTSSSTSQTSTSSQTGHTTQTSTTTSSSINYQPITWEMQSKPLSLDPAVPYESWSGSIIENLYEPLLWYNQTSSQTIPWLAQSYNVSADGLSYTFTLRQGITFCDGTSFNASAVKFSIDREILMDVPSSLVYNFGAGGLAGASQYIASNKTQADANAYLAADGVTVDGPYTVTFHLVRPSSF